MAVPRPVALAACPLVAVAQLAALTPVALVLAALPLVALVLVAAALTPAALVLAALPERSLTREKKVGVAGFILPRRLFFVPDLY